MMDNGSCTAASNNSRLSSRSGGEAGRVARYAELHCKTNFSFLRGASHPDELVKRAVALDYAALAITDRNSLAGVVRGHVAAKAVGLKLIIGAEITPQDGPALLLYAPDRKAYGRLARLITRGCLNAVKGDCLLCVEDVAAHAEGLLAVVVSSHIVASGGRQPPGALNFRNYRGAARPPAPRRRITRELMLSARQSTTRREGPS